MVNTRGQRSEPVVVILGNAEEETSGASSHTLQESDEKSSTASTSTSTSSSSSSSSEEDSNDSSNLINDDDDDDSEEDSDEDEEEEGIDELTRIKLDELLLKARSVYSDAQHKGKAKVKEDHLANNEEVIRFGEDEDEEDDDDDDEQETTPKPTTRSLPRSLTAPLRIPSNFSTTTTLSIKSANIKPDTITRDQAIQNVERAKTGQVVRGDKWGIAPLKSLSKKEMKARHQPTTGSQWFNMPQPTLTPELKREIQAMRLRNSLDPKRFYRGDAAKADSKLPEYFQIGHIINSNGNRATNAPSSAKIKKRSFVEELVEDEQARAYTKKKTKEVMMKGMSGRKGKAKRRKA